MISDLAKCSQEIKHCSDFSWKNHRIFVIAPTFRTNLECKGRYFHPQKSRFKTRRQEYARTPSSVIRRIIFWYPCNLYSVLIFNTTLSPIDFQTKSKLEPPYTQRNCPRHKSGSSRITNMNGRRTYLFQQMPKSSSLSQKWTALFMRLVRHCNSSHNLH